MAGGAAAVARPAGQGAGGHGGGPRPRRRARARMSGELVPPRASNSTRVPRRVPRRSGAPAPERRVDFLTALRDNPPPDLTAPVLAGTRDARLPPRGHPLLRCGVRHALRRRSADQSSREDDERRDRGAGAQAATASSQPIVLSEGTGKQRERPRPAPPPHVRRDARRPRRAAQGARASTCPRVRSRRRRPHRRGQIDLRRTLRAATRTGEITMLARRDRPHRTRPLLLLIDVSRLAARAHARLPALRLGRAGRDVHVRHAADAGHAAAARSATSTPRWPNVSERVEDADGGTRIGAVAAGVPRPRRATPTAPAAR